MRAIGFLILLGLTVYALIDCVRAESDEIRGLPKIVWVLLIVFVTPIGPIVWLVAGRERNVPRSPRVHQHPTAPDDDPEFLRRLAEQRRQRAEDERLRKWEAELRERDQRGDDDGTDASRA